MKLWEIFRFEFTHQIRRGWPWLSLAVLETNNGGTGGSGVFATAINMELGARKWSFDQGLYPTTDGVPATGIPGGAVPVDLNETGYISDYIFADPAGIGLALPSMRIIANLAPADLPKEGSHFDLAIVLEFNGAQPSFFVATPASSEPLRIGGFIGSVTNGAYTAPATVGADTVTGARGKLQRPFAH